MAFKNRNKKRIGEMCLLLLFFFLLYTYKIYLFILIFPYIFLF